MDTLAHALYGATLFSRTGLAGGRRGPVNALHPGIVGRQVGQDFPKAFTAQVGVFLKHRMEIIVAVVVPPARIHVGEWNQPIRMPSAIRQGLRMYGLHAEADRLSTDLFNMIFRSWHVYDNFPECFDATHGYLPEENVNVGGVGTISCPLLLLLDRIGINYSTRHENAGLTMRPVKQSGLGNLSFTATIASRRTRVTFREGHGLTMK